MTQLRQYYTHGLFLHVDMVYECISLLRQATYTIVFARILARVNMFIDKETSPRSKVQIFG